jgi:hypothetical protein
MYKLKKYWKMLHVSTIVWAQESLESELVWESYEGIKLKDLSIKKLKSTKDLIVTSL